MAIVSLLMTGVASAAFETDQTGKKLNNHQIDQLNAVKAVTEKFQDVQDAIDAGYEPVGDCVNADDIPPLAGLGLGTMGIHYFNPNLVNNHPDSKNLNYKDVLIPEQPELLLYTRSANGELVLIGAEYMVSYEEWKKIHGRKDTEAEMLDPNWKGPKPKIFGFEFEGLMEAHGLGEPSHFDKHIWLHSDNPVVSMRSGTPAALVI
ncbi:hypothetical protein [Ammoniphilus sp. 3BR4]|uniref:hypothetical protein n=1 Tax=Ammoniphilus sp. 3BR4 TaxID=3158265 RepID=UPI003467D9C9